ncbi:MAG: hypothetical protein ACYTAN_18655 [Planctomycetota bacterium]|jgi:hypothetical protein
MRKVLVLALLGMFLAAPAYSQEALGPASGGVANLEPGFPTVIADAVATPPTEWEVGAATGYETNGGTIHTGLLQVNYGVIDCVQARASWDWILGEGKVDGNGDTNLGVLWVAVMEDDSIPAMALEVAGRLPTGDGFTGYDGTILGILTKTYGETRVRRHAAHPQRHRLHRNRHGLPAS